MERSNIARRLQTFAMAVMATLIGGLVWAQEKAAQLDVDVDVDMNKGTDMSGNWMQNPLIWVIGALVLIILIALVARGGNSK